MQSFDQVMEGTSWSITRDDPHWKRGQEGDFRLALGGGTGTPRTDPSCSLTP